MTASFYPDPNRTVVWPAFAGLPRPNRPQVPVALFWPPKGASATVADYSVDLTDELAASEDAIASVSAAVSSTGSDFDLGIVWCAAMGTLATVMLGGGVPGQSYQVTLTIATAQGRVLVVMVTLLVGSDSAAAEAPAAETAPTWLGTDTGAVSVPTGAEALASVMAGDATAMATLSRAIAAWIAANTAPLAGDLTLDANFVVIEP